LPRRAPRPLSQGEAATAGASLSAGCRVKTVELRRSRRGADVGDPSNRRLEARRSSVVCAGPTGPGAA
jgi:hypothetical protein